jgi:3-keto steroid reductase
MKTRFTISRLRAHLRKQAEYSEFSTKQHAKAKAQGIEYKWENTVQRVHFLGVEADLCDLKSVYALANKLVNGTVGSPDATTMDGHKLPYGSPGTQSFSENVQQDRWALSQKPGSIGAQRSWGWGLSGIRLPRLDVIIMSAGMGGWIGLDWFSAVRRVLFDTVDALTWPTFKLPDPGAVVKHQSLLKPTKASNEATQPLLSDQVRPDEPPLGEVFCSNVFGHYILAHELMPLLSRPSLPSSSFGGKIVWVGSIEALAEHFSIDDLQALESLSAYESSKRLVDYLVLTSELPSVKRVSGSYFDGSSTVTATRSRNDTQEIGSSSSVKPKMYVTHPGVFVSDIFPLHFILAFIFRCFTYIARWLGSPWHTIHPYEGAVSAVWISLMDTEDLEKMEGYGTSKSKWGSATDTRGAERVMKTEVPGWGWNGQIEGGVDEERRKGRKRDAVDLTKEAREDFEIMGAKCWGKMEELRNEWEDTLGVRIETK